MLMDVASHTLTQCCFPLMLSLDLTAGEFTGHYPAEQAEASCCYLAGLVQPYLAHLFSEAHSIKPRETHYELPSPNLCFSNSSQMGRPFGKAEAFGDICELAGDCVVQSGRGKQNPTSLLHKPLGMPEVALWILTWIQETAKHKKPE